MTIFLSWTDPSDSIKANGYNGTVTVMQGKILCTNDDPPVAISGVGGSDFDVGLINGRTLTPLNPHSITINETEGGTLDAPRIAGENETVTLTAYPDEGLHALSLTVKDANNNVVPVTEGSDGVFTFIMPATEVTVSAVFGDTIREDINRDGSVDVTDVTALLNYIASSNPYTFDYDLDGDESIAVGDVTKLLNYIAGI